MIDVEIKAKYDDHDKIRAILKERNAKYGGIDLQTDIYFEVKDGRLKLRKSELEGALIFYSREDKQGIKPSDFHLYKSSNPDQLELLLKLALGELVVVKKKRERYFIDNIKFNLDEVVGLGKFVEIEAMTENPDDIPKLEKVVQNYIELFGFDEEDIQIYSYSDLLLLK